jgi:hypothetical protein
MSSLKTRRGTGANCRTMTTKFDWNDMPVSEEFVTVGKELQELAATDQSKMTRADLFDKVAELSTAFILAVQAEVAPREDDAQKKKDKKDEARVATRVANAESAASAKGMSQAEKDKTVAEAEARERDIIAQRAAEQVAAKQAEIEELKRTANVAEKAREDAEAVAAEKDAAHKQYVAEKEAEIQNTRARALRAENAKANTGNASKASRKRVAEKEDGNGVEAGKDDTNSGSSGGADKTPKKRKTLAEQKDEYVKGGCGTAAAWDANQATKKANAEREKKAKLMEELMPELNAEKHQHKRQAESLAAVADARQMAIQALEAKNAEYVNDRERFDAAHERMKASKKRLIALCVSKGATKTEIAEARDGSKEAGSSSA